MIYALVDPRTREVGYVGKTVLPPGVRLCNHISDARGCNDNKRRRWINALVDQGTAPEIFVIEEVCHDEWDEAERAWIAYFRSLGQAAANSHGGGQRGRPGGWRMSDEQKAKISASLKGRMPSSSSLDNLKIGQSSPVGPQHRQKISESLRRYHAQRKEAIQ